eukprot:scaffold90111_cov76-Phaeocystis_antarctica.AAC.8
MSRLSPQLGSLNRGAALGAGARAQNVHATPQRCSRPRGTNGNCASGVAAIETCRKRYNDFQYVFHSRAIEVFVCEQ